MLKIKNFLLVFAVLCLFSACKVQEDWDTLSNSYDPELALPLIKAKVILKDLVGSKNASALKIDKDGKMRLYYKGTVSERRAVDALKIFPNATIPILYDDTLKIIPFTSDLDIYRIFLAPATNISLGCVVTSLATPEMVDVTITVPGLKKNGVSFQKTYSAMLKQGAQVPFALENLGNYDLNFGQPGNLLEFRYKAKTKSGQPIKLTIVGLIQNVSFSYCEAFMKKQVLTLDPGLVDIGVYQDQIKGDLAFEDPKVTILVENSYGFPMQTKINYVKAVDAKNDTIALQATGLVNNGFDFPYPELAKNEVGKKKLFSYDFTSKTSNIKTMLNARPRTLLYDIDVIANPNSVTGVGFITDSTNLKIGIEVDIPLHLSAKNFEVTQTYEDLDLSGAFPIEKAAEFKIASDNNLPLAISLQVSFLDSLGKQLTTLAAQPVKLTEAAAVDAAGNVKTPAKNEVLVPIDAAKVALLRETRKAIFTYFLNTSNNGAVPVKILSTQDFNIRLGVKAKIN